MFTFLGEGVDLSEKVDVGFEFKVLHVAAYVVLHVHIVHKVRQMFRHWEVRKAVIVLGHIAGNTCIEP